MRGTTKLVGPKTGEKLNDDGPENENGWLVRPKSEDKATKTIPAEEAKPTRQRRPAGCHSDAAADTGHGDDRKLLDVRIPAEERKQDGQQGVGGCSERFEYYGDGVESL